MRIGILTLPQEKNYGGVLQAFAMQHTLRRLGYNAITIDRHNRRVYPSLWIHFLGYVKRLIEYYIGHKKGVSVKWNPFLTDSDFIKSMSDIRRFIDRNMKMTRPVYSDQLDQIEKEYQFDAYVVGSDQVWQFNYCPNSFLDFVKREDVIRVVYAASCSSKSFFNDKSKTEFCAELAKKFSGISVRERQLIERCETYLGISPLWVLDPTMLLRPQDYMNAIDRYEKGTSFIFTYILDENKEKADIVKEVQNLTKLRVVKGNSGEEKDNVFVPVSIDQWVNNIFFSDFVITDSFHGTAFSILFNKPFISIANKNRGLDRFLSLLGMFGLEDRLVNKFDENNMKELVDSSINFNLVNEVLASEREKAITFLKNSLGRYEVK